MLYDVITLGNTKDAEGQWEVNDAHFTGKKIELPEEPDKKMILRALKDVGCVGKMCRTNQFYIQDQTGDSFYLRAQRDHRWEFELRPARV